MSRHLTKRTTLDSVIPVLLFDSGVGVARMERGAIRELLHSRIPLRFMQATFTKSINPKN